MLSAKPSGVKEIDIYWFYRTSSRYCCSAHLSQISSP